MGNNGNCVTQLECPSSEPRGLANTARYLIVFAAATLFNLLWMRHFFFFFVPLRHVPTAAVKPKLKAIYDETLFPPFTWDHADDGMRLKSFYCH